MKKTLSLLLTLTIFASLLVPALATEQRAENTYSIAQGLKYSETSYLNLDGLRNQSFSMEYSPNGTVIPMVATGSQLYGKMDINETVAYYTGLGLNVMGAVNTDFFEIASGIPTGIVINEGKLVSSDGRWNGVAFSRDGKASIGTPALGMNIYSLSTGIDYPIYAFNKERSGSGLYLFNSDFAPDTKTTLGGSMVILEKSDSEPIRIGQSSNFTVVSVEQMKGSVALTPTQYAITVSERYSGPIDITGMFPGEQLRLDVWADPQFQNAHFATGGGDIIAKDGNITAAATEERAPRTILGVKPDGSFKIMAIDGRRGLISAGIGLREGASLLINEGYTNVINMDGGGSTAMAVRRPGEQGVYIQNLPSDGTPRKCSTYILFVNTAPTTAASKGQVYPINPTILAGTQKELSLLSYDENYSGLGQVEGSFSGNNGIIEGNIFTAPLEGGRVTVNGASGSLSVNPSVFDVVTAPDRLYLLQNGKAVNGELNIQPGGMVDFEALAFLGSKRIMCVDTEFSWTLSGNCGTLDPGGFFAACDTLGAQGTLTLSFGGTSVSTNIKIGNEPYLVTDFEDFTEFLVFDQPVESMTALQTYLGEEVRYGFGAGKISWTPTNVSSLAQLNLPLKDGTKTLSAWLKPTGTGDVYARFGLADGTAVDIPVTLQNGLWQCVMVNVPVGCTQFKGFNIMGAGFGTLLVDSIWGNFDNRMPDTEPPTLQILVNEEDAALGTYHVSIYDKNPLPIAQKNISVTCDGVAIPFEYNQAASQIAFTNLDNTRPHRLTVKVKDFFGNLSKVHIDISPEEIILPFTDLEGHWARPYIGVLNQGGIFASTDLFNPDMEVSSEMMATILSRYMGVDVSRYADLALPFEDKGEISDWAMPHVKALYAMGIMRGSDDGKLYFYPKASITRAQVITLLGRSVSRGYTVGQVTFTDSENIPSWALDSVALLEHTGVLDKYKETGLLEAKNPMPRCEIASLLYNMY